MLKVALAQINATVGDLEGNSQLIEAAAREAYAKGARLVVSPELSLTGYPPEDLLLRPAFMRACDDALHRLARRLEDLAGLSVLVGHPVSAQLPANQRSKSLAAPACFN
ncbi:MAG: nitrilase-related carbon-nitrogen hydrolase, partial [Rubrivivax sp.]